MLAARRHFSYSENAWGRVLVTGAVARGAIDYLGIPANTPDTFGTPRERCRSREAYPRFFPTSNNWGPKTRSAATGSYYRTKADTGAMDWNTEGFWLSLGSEYLPSPGLVLGLDITCYLDSAWSGGTRRRRPCQICCRPGLHATQNSDSVQ